MLRAQAEGRPFVNAHHTRELAEKLGRTVGSVGQKHGNLSAVLKPLGFRTLSGFGMRPHFQQAIILAVERYLEKHSESRNLGQPGEQVVAYPGVAEATGLPPFDWEEGAAQSGLLPVDAPPEFNPNKPSPPAFRRLVRKYDPAARDQRNRVLGRLGEKFVLNHERAFLVAHGRSDLLPGLEWTSDVRGDGAGYDIRSFTPDGVERLIEVKATCGGPTTQFFLTRTEREVSQQYPDTWRLYRVYGLPNAPRIFQLKPPLETVVSLKPESWRAEF